MEAALRIAVGIPTIVAGDHLDPCVRSVLAQAGVACDLSIVENGSAAAEACARWESEGITIHRPGRNLGVAASWNLLCDAAWERGYDAIVLLNDDTVLTESGSLARFRSAVAADAVRVYFLNASRFAAFCVSRPVWDAVGAFDDGYWPGYYEDLDWHLRARRAGLPWSELDVPSEHVGGGTRLADPALQALIEVTYPLNDQRYRTKWGGPPDAEEFAAEWNGGEPLPSVVELVGDARPRRSLDLGCRTVPRGEPGWERWGVDLVPSASTAVVEADLAFEPIPFADCHFERVFAYDFLEHVPMRAYVGDSDGHVRTVNAIVELFDEIYRVLAPGGIFESLTPHLPHWQEVYRDPTHVSFWTEQTWDYLSRPGEFLPLGRHYGLRSDFELVRKEWRGAHLYVELQKPG